MEVKQVGNDPIVNSTPCEITKCPNYSFKRCIYKYPYICGKEESAGCRKRYCRNHEFEHQEKYRIDGEDVFVWYTCCTDCEKILLKDMKKAQLVKIVVGTVILSLLIAGIAVVGAT